MGKSFLGRGWKFPIQVDETTGRIMTSEYEEDIQESLQIILRTSKGERVMRPDFGCRLSDFSFSVIDETTIRLMQTSILEAVQAWEPRVHQVEVKIDRDKEEMGKLWIRLTYVVRTTNNLFNQVYPYYIYEGAK
ncbi:GPW/gp25 family protein [Bacillus horti]|uniref:Phage baseplate assembly protein W n=1 Tax=Caldalkalibacillus horti TaxID=77523 RepID=A0ABT9VZY6_9BACI|nr:GPW/gp25 family protein [Bacillus horti]MDQ0166566.1 phage baseplate assembly protein W [Bacillus horti]